MKGLLQNSFLQRPFFALCEISLVAQNAEKIARFLHSGTAKLTEAYSPVFLWITFLCLTATKLFWGNNGFSACSFAASSTAF